MRILPALFLATLALGFAAAHAADVYRWTDDKGVTHFSDSPPTDTQYQRVNVRTGSVSEVADTNVNQQAEEAPSAVTTDREAIKAERCQIARRNLDALRTGFATIAGEDGQPRVLTEAELAQQREVNTQIVASDCPSD